MQIINIANIIVRIVLYGIILSIQINEHKLCWKNKKTVLRIIGSVTLISIYSVTLFLLPTPFSKIAHIKYWTDVALVIGLFAGYIALLTATIMWTVKSCKKITDCDK